MSEIAKSAEGKVRQFWLAGHHSDPENLVFIFDTPDVGVHVIEAEPVLKLLREMGDSLNSIARTDIRDSPYDILSLNEWRNSRKEWAQDSLNKLNTFLASIDKGENNGFKKS